MTIETSAQLSQALDEIRRLYAALDALKAEVLHQNTHTFAVMAEGTVDHIRRLQGAVDSYVGATVVEEHAVPLWLRVAGPHVGWPQAPTSVLTEFLDALRKGILAAAAIEENQSEEREEHEGVLIEIDLDRLSFRIRPKASPDVTCEFAEEWKELAKEGLGKTVRVIGIRFLAAGRHRRSLRVGHLEIVEEDAVDTNGL